LAQFMCDTPTLGIEHNLDEMRYDCVQEPEGVQDIKYLNDEVADKYARQEEY
jgi:hypothetical protein